MQFCMRVGGSATDWEKKKIEEYKIMVIQKIKEIFFNLFMKINSLFSSVLIRFSNIQ